MLSWRIILVVTFAGVLAAGTGALTMHLSVWFLWEAASGGEVRLAVNQRHPAVDTISQYALAALVPELTPYRNDIRAFAISKKGSAVTFIAQPRRVFSPAAQRELARELKRDGWQVERLGLALVARDHTQETAPLLRTIVRALGRRFAISRPLAILGADAGTVPGYRDPLAAVATGQEGEITIAAAQSISQLAAASSAEGAYVFPGPAEISLSLPGSVASALPAELLAEWNSLLIQRLGFKHTSPNLIASFSAHDSMALRLSEAGAAIAASGNVETLKAAIAEALAAEEAYLRPQQRAFRLPDGTIGREVVPGEAQTTVSPAPGSCTETAGITACTTNNSVALGATRELAQQALQEGPWHIRVGEQYLKAAGLQLQAISAIGDSEKSVIKVQLAQ